tara:strand:- start:3510 stop:4592 length:1083 start_codon:yes stop_codon:yes gene_type:complete
MELPQQDLVIKRHDSSIDHSLRPYSAADEYLLNTLNNLKQKPNALAIYHDRFGFLSCLLNSLNHTTIITNKSQFKAIELNAEANSLSFSSTSDPLSPLATPSDFVLMKVPKSFSLFQLYLEHIAQNSTNDVTVVVSFMTRHFSTKILDITQQYFENIEQSRAVKKSRVLTLTGKKQTKKQECIDVLEYNGTSYRQYWGVFSAKHIDYATQYLLEHIELKATDNSILDLASGNGVIGNEISKKLSNATVHLMDDSYLAVESAKLNVQGENIHHHFNNNLNAFEAESLDVIATNPPFHFEYEIDIQIPIQLFKECYRCLKPGGNLQIVANNHLNYSSHLKTIFPTVKTVAQNENFVVIKCEK